MVNSHNRTKSGDRVLIVEADPLISDLIGRQALHSVGYQIQIATDATNAIAKALQWAPDLILIDLNLPGLSGKDLMVALASQGIQAPLIVIAQRGTEADIIQTFRLGAADYLLLPAREAEVVNAVNRVLQQVHDRRERDRLAQQLQQANQEMQARVRELTTIFAVGKAMTSITDHAYLLEKILDAAVRSTQADLGWFLLREDVKKPFVIVAEKNLPAVLGVRLNQPWDDGISSLVAMSGEKLSIQGDPLRRFKISGLGQSALIVPIKVQKTVIGLL
ncbi:MAG: response regulator, partial [Anaerolineaceae bacterium]|nr:response regulator [Anaerolineaceae bacterium]